MKRWCVFCEKGRKRWWIFQVCCRFRHGYRSPWWGSQIHERGKVYFKIFFFNIIFICDKSKWVFFFFNFFFSLKYTCVYGSFLNLNFVATLILKKLVGGSHSGNRPSWVRISSKRRPGTWHCWTQVSSYDIK